MRSGKALLFQLPLLFICLLPAAGAYPQERGEPGKTIAKVSIAGNLILLELNEGALGREKLFDLDRHTLRFTPANEGYRVENLPLEWDAGLGQKINEPNVALRNFSFPFSGQNWHAFTVGVTGSIRFGEPDLPPGSRMGSAPRDPGGVSIGRFDALGEAAGNLVNTVPAICVFFKPRMSGDRYVKELADRVVVSWDVTEPYGNIQDFAWTKTVNRFQAVLHQDGAMEMSYDQLAARDAIVGIYPLISADAEKPVSSLSATKHVPSAAHLDLQKLKLSLVGGVLLKATFETAGPVLPRGDPRVPGIAYRVYFYARAPGTESAGALVEADAVWTIRGFASHNRPDGGAPRYFAFGDGVSRGVETSGNTISVQGVLPSTLRGAKEIYVSADASAAGSQEPVAAVSARKVGLAGMHTPEVHLSSLKPQDGPFPVLYEAFHYYALPNPRDMSCTVIQSLGDKFDFLAYYSDFRVDNQEAGTPSDGPLGAVGGAVTGIGANQRGLESYCTPGRFQWGFVQPVYVGSNQMQERPPADAPRGTDRDITFYEQQLAEISSDGKMPPYMYAMSQIAHEMGHRWAAFVSAKLDGETIPLGPVHWARGLQASVAFPYRRPTEASIMGGGVWQDNFDGTYTQLDDDYYVPATGWSYLDLYLMGLIHAEEVPDFFLLRNLVPAGKDAKGHPIFKADRSKVTIQEVIRAEGPRLPGVDKSQREFNTGMVIIVQHGKKPSHELIERVEGIRKQWMDYFSITTGHRASMTANPR